ncbi:pyruvate, water dikinase regulatory protein [uncultured Tessaracoccus sp.]|uniref:pyruvate, water dikinase regulatory protein n=1 Tax=uncultured Tessaracoccus sp. TaxID=905023 RepID=UPI002637F353|nr:pyruvate, water dikinase regulatory protein [uncultured Tessaracoccus sp.]
MSTEPLEIHIIADSTGETGARIARAALAQFPDQHIEIVRHRRVSQKEHVETALAELPLERPIVVLFTLVKPSMADLVERFCNDYDLPHADLMTDSIAAIEQASGERAEEVMRRPVGVEADYFTRVSAMDFAVRNDDGSVPEQLREADIVLIGPSRAGKTPLSIYLGYLGYKAANVPLVPGITPPSELFSVERWRIIGLTMDADRLQSIRNQRVRSMGGFGNRDGYADLAHIYDELDEVGQTMRDLGCPVLNTTGVALEENASRIVDLVSSRARRLGGVLRQPPGVRCAARGAGA